MEKKRKIFDLEMNETAFVVPFAMCIKSDGKFFLSGNFFIKDEPDSQHCLKIKKIDRGIIVFYNEIDYSWPSWPDSRLESYNIPVVDCTDKRNPKELQRELEMAIILENYELAAKIRDEIKALK